MKLLTSLSVRRRVTIAVWLLGLLAATILIARKPSSQIRGIAWGEPAILAAPIDGTLATVPVLLHQAVVIGELVARLDPDLLTARAGVLTAEIQALIETQASDRQGRARVFERDREEAGLRLGELTARVEEAQARLQALNEQLAVDERLFEEGVGAAETALAVRREMSIVETRLAADRERLTLARSSARKASQRAGDAPGTNEWQIEAARRELSEVEMKIAQLSLHSGISGQITEIYRHPGEWLEAGDQVLRITPTMATEVRAWMDSRAAPNVVPGVAARVRRSNGESLAATVKSVGVERLLMPRSMWSRSDMPEWGYQVRVEVSEEDGEFLAPGEPVQVAVRADVS